MTTKILGIGAITSVGENWHKTIEALDGGKIGLHRDRKAIGVDGLPMTLAPVWPLHEIHNPLERLARLATVALLDLADKGFDTTGMVGITLCLPAWVHQGRHGDSLRARLAERWSLPTKAIMLSFADQTTILDLVFAAQDSSSPQILLVAETYLLAELLDSLTAADRVLSSYQPHGLVPSEAAVALYLGPTEGQRGYAITALQRGVDEVDPRQPATLMGLVLANLARAVLFGSEMPQRVLCDLNGERWRSEEAAVVASRCADRLPIEVLADIEAPACQTGYSGVAVSGLLLALACRGARSAPEMPGDSLVLISHFDGTRIAANVSGRG
ncbi:hypothetical protein [Paracoccus sp. Ld10]|uniref:hypothetical protein n=1 Tax=Paracoccus sp. Ld10 TaxID=649158 RepID=UPI00386F5CE7